MGQFRAMNEEELSNWLDSEWEETLADYESEPDEEIDRFIDSSVVSIRYAFLTQLLGKYADPTRDLLCLQRGKQDPDVGVTGRWDPRGFCTRVVVPWVQRHHSVLGTSTDPYVNKPLRRPRLDQGMDSLKSRQEWDALVSFLTALQDASDTTMVKDAVLRCLKSLARRLREQQVEYPVPMRIGLDHLCDILDRYLEVANGGLRPLVVATALMRTIGEAYSLFPRVESQGVNEADTASGVPGDIMCYGEDGALALAVEVKGYELTLIELEATIAKARSSHVSNILFTTPGLASVDKEAIGAKITEEFAQGSNIYQTSIGSLARSSFMLLKETWRVRFLQEVCSELDARSTQPSDRLAFADLLTR